MKRALIIGAGVAGCSCCYFLQQKGYHATLLEKTDGLGGMCRTYYYNGHPYEFGPHVWSWNKKRENDFLLEMTQDEVYQLNVKLYTFTGEALWRFPVHFDDIMMMSDRDKILNEWKATRDENHKLIPERMPPFETCSYEAYLKAALGETLYNRFTRDYVYKMWGVPGNELKLSKMIGLDILQRDGVYDPVKFVKQHFLGAGIPNWYPKKGWNPIWKTLTNGAEIYYNVQHIALSKVGLYVNFGNRSEVIQPSDYDAIICTIHADTLFGECKLPTNGRLIIPFLIPNHSQVFPDAAQCVYYSDNSAVTRALEFKKITQYESPDTLITMEIPIIGGNTPIFPGNVEVPAHVNKRCYPRQTEEALAMHQEYIKRAQEISSHIYFCGRDADFKYSGIPETVYDAIELTNKL